MTFTGLKIKVEVFWVEWECGKQGPPKRRYPTTSLRGVTTWRWRQ